MLVIYSILTCYIWIKQSLSVELMLKLTSYLFNLDFDIVVRVTKMLTVVKNNYLYLISDI